MRLLYFGDRKARVGRMENRDVAGQNLPWGSMRDFFQVLLAVWAQASVTSQCKQTYSVMQELICWIHKVKACEILFFYANILL